MSASDVRDFDVVIVGAGVIGAAMASLLLARNLSAPGRVAIVADRFAAAVPMDADWDLRVFALSRASERVLKACGVWESLPAQRVFAYERMCVWDAGGEPNGRGSLSFDCAEIAEPNLGFIVDGRALQWQCLQAARAAGAVLIEGGPAAIIATDTDSCIRLSDGRALRSQLLIAADGQESKTRALLGIETAGHTYRQKALVAHVRTAKPHCNTAWQRFLGTGPLAFLPLPDGRSSIVWSTTLSEAARLSALDAAAFGAALTAASGEFLGACELSTSTASYPLKLQYALDYVRPRAVLLGDAAHVVHPLAGQGLNLGLLDCAALADVLAQAGGAGFSGEHRLLRRYERWRRSENLMAAGALDGLERLFSTTDTFGAGLRAAGLAAVGRAPLIKRRLAQRALGLIGDVPQFLKADRPWPHK
ncbi:MAG TPA: FAD-dependent monooxygenase [Steroidobacteraceae bacterium]|jgi:2-octaprenylphenol hydroxylase|nr:FAD-dependent monooxygenase [Steroidobacteraceae bacterium]